MTASGYAGVTFFFVLSGFVITYNYLDNFQSGHSGGRVRDYLVARFARVYPLYVLCLVPGWIAGGGDIPWRQLLLVQAWHPDVGIAFGMNGPARSVSVEAFLYLTFPLLIPALGRFQVLSSRKRLAAVAASVVIILFALALTMTLTGQSLLGPEDPHSAHRWLYRTPLTRLGDFVLGVLGAVYVMRFASTSATHTRSWGYVTMAAVAVVVALAANETFYRSAFSWDVGYAVPALIIFVGLAINQQTILSRVLSSRVMVLLGGASYALYLVHTLPVGLHPLKSGTLAADLGFYAIFLGLLTMTAIGMHVAIEKPARRLIRRLLVTRQFSTQKAGAVTESA